MEIGDAILHSLPVIAVTNHGRATTDISQQAFADFHLAGKERHDKVQRNWSGFRTVPVNEDWFVVFQLIERFWQSRPIANAQMGWIFCKEAVR